MVELGEFSKWKKFNRKLDTIYIWILGYCSVAVGKMWYLFVEMNRQDPIQPSILRRLSQVFREQNGLERVTVQASVIAS